MSFKSTDEKNFLKNKYWIFNDYFFDWFKVSSGSRNVNEDDLALYKETLLNVNAKLGPFVDTFSAFPVANGSAAIRDPVPGSDSNECIV